MGKRTFTINESVPELSVVNTETGEIVSGVYKKKVESIDDFIMIFLSNLSALYDLEGLELKVMMQCWKKSMYSDGHNGNIILNDAEFKDSFANDGLSISSSTIDVYISKLSKKGLLIRLSKGKYMLNPEYFWKGKLTDRSKVKLIIENA